MRIPSSLSKLIEADHEISAFVNNALSAFTPWVGNSPMPLFPEFTDHSIAHIEQVMQTAVDLATDGALQLISAKDAAALVVGTCLHDCAMHLSEDGFFTLVRPDNKWAPVPDFDSRPWNAMWEDFLGEARRFDGRKLLAIFGDTDPVQRPPKKITDLSMRDRLLMGEFIRRNHARLAHEIALYGIPGTSGTAVRLVDTSSEAGERLGDIAGLIARSHGMSLRSAAKYLGAHYHIRDFQGVHGVFLMVLVRIADYLQIQAKRAPSEVLKVRHLVSPVSQGEWKVHSSIHNITPAGDDPEAIFIDARPEDVQSFLRAKEWLDGIQNELDVSWAVLGEVYGRYPKERLDRLGLRLRRVNSSIDDVAEFARTASYVPAKISFDAANPDLLKLLVGPLYGEDPGIGLRELIQNAVDAVRELDELRKHRPELRTIETRKQDADVVVTIDCDRQFRPTVVTVTDRGIGMDLNVVRDYFLKAGASFRRSDAWRKNFEDSTGHSTVIRSGRFGVGALAAFLIGDQIRVATRSIYSPENRGIEFTANLDDSSLSLSWVSCPIGTDVQIAIPEHHRELIGRQLQLSYFKRDQSDKMHKITFWHALGQYFAPLPSVLRTIRLENGVPFNLDVADYVPADDAPATSPWRCFESDSYHKVFWTYNKSYPHLLCNGIVVSNTGPHSEQIGEELDLYHFTVPSILVYDRDGKLPLDLQRTGLTRDDPELSDRLIVSVVDDLIANALVEGVENIPPNSNQVRWLKGKYPGFDQHIYDKRRQMDRWFLAKTGFGYIDQTLILSNQPASIIVAFDERGTAAEGRTAITSKVMSLMPSNSNFFFGTQLDYSSINDRKFLARSLLEWTTNRFNGFPETLNDVSIVGRRLIIRAKFISDLLRDPGLGKTLKKILSNFKVEAENGEWLLVALGKCPPGTAFPFAGLSPELLEESKIHAMVECYPGKAVDDHSPMAERWMEILGDSIIPFAPEERSIQFPLAFKKLHAHVELWKFEIAQRSKNRKSIDEVNNDDDPDELNGPNE